MVVTGSLGGRTRTRTSRRGKVRRGGSRDHACASLEIRGSSRDSAFVAQAACSSRPFTGNDEPRLQPRTSMTPFRYRAARADGGIVEGIVEAASANQASSVVTD